MTIKFLPSELLAKVAPEKTVEKLVTQKLTLNRTVLNQLSRSEIVTKKTLEKTAMKVIKSYRQTYGDEREAGLSKTDALESALNEKKLMIQRVQNTIVTELTDQVKDKYDGTKYRWLPSDAGTPDPEHQLNYGLIFTLGVGEAPGDRIGCRCGMEILTDDEEIEL